MIGVANIFITCCSVHAKPSTGLTSTNPLFITFNDFDISISEIKSEIA